jgi:hypothetical protein
VARGVGHTAVPCGPMSARVYRASNLYGPPLGQALTDQHAPQPCSLEECAVRILILIFCPIDPDFIILQPLRRIRQQLADDARLHDLIVGVSPCT